MKFMTYLLTLSLAFTTSCSSPDDAGEACRELNVLITSLENREVSSISAFHDTVDAILVHARNAANEDRGYAQLANKIQTFSSMWYAKYGSTVPKPDQTPALKDILNEFCN